MCVYVCVCVSMCVCTTNHLNCLVVEASVMNTGGCSSSHSQVILLSISDDVLVSLENSTLVPTLPNAWCNGSVHGLTACVG